MIETPHPFTVMLGGGALDTKLRAVAQIVNSYLKEPFTPSRLYDCQDELIEAGFEEYAQI